MALPRQTTSPSIEIIFEDDSLLAINKPHSIHSVRNSRSKNLSVADLLAEQFPKLVSASRNKNDVGLVNRLDYETSGVLVAAKTREVWEALHQQLSHSHANKKYIALVDGSLEKLIRAQHFIGSDSRSSKKVRTSPHAKSRYLPAETVFIPIHKCKVAGATLVCAETGTGRRHQIRAHAGALRHPLCGDSLYGSKVKLAALAPKLLPANEALPPFILHAWEMRLTHPRSQKELAFVAPLPVYLRHLAEGLRLKGSS